jgi:signal transduction histidine kinase/ligand-binding sensor domain-containing protein/DNA-binding response OmpR family regulator
MKPIFLFIFLLSSFQFQLFAKKYDITYLTNNNGLSNSSINSIYQDSNGLLWIGTWDGLNVYNGREFKAFMPDPNNPQSISNNIIRDIIEEQKNIYWIATDVGINRLDLSKKTFKRFFVDTDNQIITKEHSFFVAKNSSNRIFAAIYGQGIYFFDTHSQQFIRLNITNSLQIKKIFFDSTDNLWIYTENKSLIKVTFKKGIFNTPQIEQVINFQQLKNIESIFYHSNNEIWMETASARIYSYQISKGILTSYPISLQKTGNIVAMAFMGTYQLWGTRNGLFRFDLKTKQIESVIPNVSVLSLFPGTQQIVWVGTDMQGIWVLNPPHENFQTYSLPNISSFGVSAVRAFFENENHTLWVGTKGSGIYTFFKDKNTKPILHLTTTNGLLSNSVFTIVKGQNSEYWIGTDGNGINYFDPKTNKIYTLSVNDMKQKINLSSIYSILPTEQSTLWVGTSGYGMYKLEIDRSTRPYSIEKYKQYIFNNHSSSLSNNIVYAIINDANHFLWIATRGGGLNRFNIQTERFESFRFSPTTPNCISSDDILCLHKDTQGFLWVGTSMGLNKLQGFENGKPIFIHFTEKEGMPNNTIHGILEDKEHNLWLSTNNGIAKLVQDKSGYRIISYFKKDGLQNNEFSDGAFYESPYTYQFYFGGISGFNMFNPSEITSTSYIPTLLLDDFYLDNIETNISDYMQPKKTGETLILSSYKNKSFSFKFIPLDFLSSSKCEISYLLQGYQKNWINLGTSNIIVFSNLPTGKYVLKVRCSNADKIWSSQYFSLPITMLPPWWASTFAYICYMMLFFLFLFGILRFVKYQLTVRNNIKTKELEKQKTEEIHEAKLTFFTNIAHEFSNSLTLIYGPCEQLLRTHLYDEYTRKYINIIKTNSERMQNLIQQLIEFRKVETGHLRLKIELIDIPELVRFVIDHFMDVLEQEKIHVSLIFHPTDILWHTDRDSVEKILFNLISNAVKYTPQNEIIEVQVEAKDNLLFLRVTNSGVGIPPAYHQSIFDRFEVLDQFEKQMSKGLKTQHGIGLALCKNIVEVLQGNIEVKSDGETFTSFLVSLPKQDLDEYALPKNQESFTLPIVKSKTTKVEVQDKNQLSTTTTEKNGLILVIDDDNEIRQLLKDFLSEKYEVAEAANGQEAIELINIRIPLIIVCDIIMPIMNGLEFTKIMKEQDQLRHVPIILLSSKSTVESQIEGLEIGADAYLSKPFHPRHLEVLIESLLHRNKAVLDYNESSYAALEQFEGKFIHREDKDLMVHITKIINDHIDNEALSLDFIANETAFSKMQLYRKIKEITELTPTEYIRSIRLKQAEKLLKTTNKTVQEIMYNCGFNNKAYFYREFSKKHHLTPKEFRSQLNK